MDLYSTYTLQRTVSRMREVPQFFLSTFFPTLITHQTEEIYFDRVEDKPRLSPFVHPLREGKLIEALGFTTDNLRPAYIKDKRVHDTEKPIKRMAGEAFGGEMTNDQRLAAILAQDLFDQQKMLSRRLEVMAANAIIDGKLTITGEGFDSILVDFKRDPSLNIALAGADKWDADPTPSITDQLEDWDSMLLDISGFNGRIVIMDAKAWRLARRDPKLREDLDKRRGTESIDLNLAPMMTVEGVSYKGRYGDFSIFTYQHTYVDPVDGLTKQVMPENTVIMANPGGVEGVRHFGAIKDLDAGLQAFPSFFKSWTVPDPSARFLLMQSAPLTAPHRPNASLKVKVA